MSTKLAMVRDINGYITFGLPFSVDQFGGYLTTGVEQNITVPSNFKTWEAHFSFMPGSSVWVSLNDTAALPNGTLDSVNCELNPACRYVQAGDVISMITDDATNDWVGVTLYAIQ